jgi:protocatechuate 3,4-dioxygenase beta subunit
MDYPPYRSTILRHPHERPPPHRPGNHRADRTGLRTVATSTLSRPDLTIQASGDPIGERIIVTGRVLDAMAASPCAGQLVEIWQAQRRGRYIHKRDQHHAPDRP